LSEGCRGGWSIFNGFFAENGYLVEESCAPYTGRTKGRSCGDFQSCEPYARISHSYYINNYNYGPTEKQIQKELLRNGPVVADMVANFDQF